MDLGGFITGRDRPLVKGSGTSCIVIQRAYEVVEGGALASRGDEYALHEEFVLAFDGEWRVLFHGLEQHWQSASDGVENAREK